MTSALVWADSGPGVGLGHLARCGALAVELRARGRDVVVMTPGGPAGAAMLEGITDVTVVADRGIAPFVDAIGERRGPVVVVDTYRWSREDYAAARRGASLLAVFSDDPADVPPCDIVVNGVPGADTLGYDRHGATRYLLGAPFFPLRGEFRDAPPKTIAPVARRVLVTAGGEDVHGLLGLFAQAACDVYPDAEVVAVIGAGGFPAVPARAAARIAPPDYPRLVREADVMVCGAGQALIEAAAAGTPAAAVLVGPDQRHQQAAVLAAGACVDGGAWTLDRGRHAAVLRSALERLADASVRAAVSGRGRALVDGRGAARIAETIEAHARAGRE